MRRIQLFPGRLSHKRGKAYATMSKGIMGNGGFYGCLIESQGVSAWLKETAQTRVFLLARPVLLNHLKPQSSKTKLLLPIMPIGIVACAFTLVWDNLCRNSCMYKTYRVDIGGAVAGTLWLQNQWRHVPKMLQSENFNLIETRGKYYKAEIIMR